MITTRISIAVCTTLLAACAGADRTEGEPIEVVGSEQVALVSDLPPCSGTRVNAVYYVLDAEQFFFCDGREYRQLDLGGLDGADGTDGANGVDGSDGTTSLLSMDAAAFDDCAWGGVTISVGLDDDADGQLGADEVDDVDHVCNGAPGEGDDDDEGPGALVQQLHEPAGVNCAHGGVRIDTGLDDDGDGELDTSEIDDTSYVCNGSDPEECLLPGTTACGSECAFLDSSEQHCGGCYIVCDGQCSGGVCVLPAPLELSSSVVELLGEGGTGVVSVALYPPAPPEGATVLLTSSDVGVVAVPQVVTIPGGAAEAAFRIHALASAPATTTLSATLGAATTTMLVAVVDTASPPEPHGLRINEVNADPAGADANCNGIADVAQDEFVELINTSPFPVQLAGVSIQDSFTVRFSFGLLVLGPGEAVVVFGGAGPTAATSPWCVGATATTIGDAIALAGSPLALGNDGQEVFLVAADGADLDDYVFDPFMDESWTRCPDGTGGFQRHSSCPGHATDRRSSPGTRSSGQPFAGASP